MITALAIIGILIGAAVVRYMIQAAVDFGVMRSGGDYYDE